MADVLDLEIDRQEDDMQIEEDEEGDLERLKERARKRKGRGFQEKTSRENVENYESIAPGADDDLDLNALRSVEGWILIVTGIHEEGHEDDVHGRFTEFGEIKNLHLNLDRRSGFIKGYALVEYEHYKNANEARLALNGSELLGNTIHVDWAFTKRPIKTTKGNRRRR